MGTAAELDLECVISFLALWEEGHFGRASIRLHLSSPALTKRIQRLEHQLGVKLIERGPTGASALTAAGWRFLPRARAVIELARSAQVFARSAAHAPITETVRIGVPGVLDSDPTLATLIRLLGASREWIPGAEIRCVGVPFGQVTDALLSHKADILWIPSAFEHPGLESQVLGSSPRVGIVPDHHPLAGESSVDVDQFAAQPLLYHPGVPVDLMSPGWLADIRPRSKARLVVAEVPGIAALKKAVKEGRGVVVLPCIPGMSSGPGFRTLTLDGAPAIKIYAVYHRGRRTGLVNEVVELLRLITSSGSIPSSGARDVFQLDRGLKAGATSASTHWTISSGSADTAH
jgi:DNA-binding transcriptional LysR family regulator